MPAMQLTKQQKIITSAVVVLLLFGMYVFFDRRSKEVTPSQLGDQASTTLDNNKNSSNSTAIAGMEGTGDYKIEQVFGNEGAGVPQPVPDLNRKVTPSQGAYVTAEAKLVATAKILEYQSKLKQNTADVKSWINLGIYQKMAGDFDGAVLSWKYAGRLSPTDYVSLGNLANLYAYFLNDIDKAESYYKEAILKGPTQVSLYIQLAELYRDVFRDKEKAKLTVEAGLQKIPNDPNLLKLEASLNQ